MRRKFRNDAESMDRSLAISFISFGACLSDRIISHIDMEIVTPVVATPAMLAIIHKGSAIFRVQWL